MIDAARTITRLDNHPPLEDIFRLHNEQLPDQLATDCKPDIDRAQALIENAANVPTVIANEEEEAKATDIVSQMNKHAKVLEARRMGINSGPRTAKDIIDGFFKLRGIDPLQKAVDRITPGLTKFKREKAERERREREEKERLAREEAARLERERQEAERKRREAEAAKLKAEREAAAAEERRQKAIEDERLAKERQRKAEQEAREAEQRAADAETKRAKAKAEREAREAQERAEAEERARQTAREDQERARADIADARTEKALAKGELSDANKEAKTATKLASHAEGDVYKAEKATTAKLSTISGARGDLGGHSSLRTRWVGELVDRNLLDKKVIWEFISDEALQDAINSYVRTHKGKRELRGARIFESSETVVR